jgi:hypothetical protein
MMKLHGHPQKTEYTSPAEWPRVQAQAHWPQIDPTMAGHIHIIPSFPLYGEIMSYEPIEIPFTLMLHMFPGRLGLFQGEYVSSVRWDETGTEQMPAMIGDPMGLRQWSGVATLDFTRNVDPINNLFLFPEHGWTEVRFFTRSVFDNQDQIDLSWAGAVYSLIDPSKPERPAAEQGNPGVHFRSSAVLSRNGIPIAGEMITEISDYIPLLPIDQPWKTIINAYNYTAPVTPVLAEAHFELRLDANLHMGVRGTLQDQQFPVPGTRQVIGPLVLDPAVMGTGAHTELALWIQPMGDESVSSVVSFPVTVGAGVPPPPPPVEVTVPSVVGLTQFAAGTALVNAGLAMGTVTSLDDAMPTGQVIAQSPAAGARVAPESTINLSVSLGAGVPAPVEEWKENVPVTFMQLFVNGVPQPRFQICDMQGHPICRELTTTPGTEM